MRWARWRWSPREQHWWCPKNLLHYWTACSPLDDWEGRGQDAVSCWKKPNWSQQINCSGRWSRTAHFKTLTLLLVPFQGHHHREECRRFYGDSSEKRPSHSLLVDTVQPESEEHECSMENLLWMKRSDSSHFYNLEHLFIINPGIECMINS